MLQQTNTPMLCVDVCCVVGYVLAFELQYSILIPYLFHTYSILIPYLSHMMDELFPTGTIQHGHQVTEHRDGRDGRDGDSPRHLSDLESANCSVETSVVTRTEFCRHGICIYYLIYIYIAHYECIIDILYTCVYIYIYM